MEKPEPGDQVFDAKMKETGNTARAKVSWDSVVALAREGTKATGCAQVHHEHVVYDGDQIYPEFAVFYRLDSEEEQAETEAEVLAAIALAEEKEAEEDALLATMVLAVACQQRLMRQQARRQPRRQLRRQRQQQARLPHPLQPRPQYRYLFAAQACIQDRIAMAFLENS